VSKQLHIEDSSTLPVTWQKGLRSNNSDACADVAAGPDGMVYMRNSRDPQGPALAYTREEWNALFLGIKDGEFDNI